MGMSRARAASRRRRHDRWVPAKTLWVHPERGFRSSSRPFVLEALRSLLLMPSQPLSRCRCGVRSPDGFPFAHANTYCWRSMRLRRDRQDAKRLVRQQGRARRAHSLRTRTENAEDFDPRIDDRASQSVDFFVRLSSWRSWRLGDLSKQGSQRDMLALICGARASATGRKCRARRVARSLP